MLDDVKFNVVGKGKKAVVNLVRIHTTRGGNSQVVERGKDVSLDMVDALARKMAYDLKQKKKKDNLGYIGYNVEGIGRVLFILPNYEYRIVKPFS